MKLEGGGLAPPFFAAALTAAACSASCFAALSAALLFDLGAIVGAQMLLGRGFAFEADEGGRAGPTPLAFPLMFVISFTRGEGDWSKVSRSFVFDGERVPRTDVQREMETREGLDAIVPGAWEAGRTAV